MILRVLALAGGIAGGAITSQFPEFSQQYTQRLGGAVDALADVVSDFDASAAAAGLNRDEALAELRGNAFLKRRGQDMARTFARYEQLSADLSVLENAGPFMRAYHAQRLRDGQVARATLNAYEPAVPLTTAGGIFAAVGFLAGWVAIRAALRLAQWPFRHRAQT